MTAEELRRQLRKQDLRIAELEKALSKAERDIRTREAYLTGIGHAIRTPLNGILGMTNLVLESNLTAEQRRYLEMATTSAERLLDVVGDIFDLYRSEAGLLRLTAEDFNLQEVLGYELYLLQLAARQKNLDLHFQFDRSLPETVNGDPDRYLRVVANLVDNAIKFTEQGRIDVIIDYHGVDELGKAVIKTTVTDSGTGIHQDHFGRIRGFLSGNAEADDFADIAGGLGLALSSRLVRLAGGQIDFSPTYAAGASFWFTWRFDRSVEHLDRRPVQSSQEVSSGQAHFMLKGNNVLLAEDDPVSRVLIETLLTQIGIRVHTVENGRQAVEAMAAESFQAVLMDVQMPVMDGLEATREIGKLEGARRVPIIALTAYAQQGDRERCLQAGMDDYLAKPVGKEALYNVLYRYLTRSALVVISEPESQQKAVEWLIEKGWRTTIAETGRAAQYEASLMPFDLVLLDMGIDDGQRAVTIETIRRLDSYTGRRSLVIGIKGKQTAEGVYDTYRELGVTAFLEAPLSLEHLGQVIVEGH